MKKTIQIGCLAVLLVGVASTIACTVNLGNNKNVVIDAVGETHTLLLDGTHNFVSKTIANGETRTIDLTQETTPGGDAVGLTIDNYFGSSAKVAKNASTWLDVSGGGDWLDEISLIFGINNVTTVTINTKTLSDGSGSGKLELMNAAKKSLKKVAINDETTIYTITNEGLTEKATLVKISYSASSDMWNSFSLNSAKMTWTC